MGGSLGLAARERARRRPCRGYDPDPAAREAALERGCVDEPSHGDLARGGRGRRPRRASARRWRSCRPCVAELAALAPGATVTDIGSTKAGVVAAVPPADRAALRRRAPDLRHARRAAPQNARAELFEGATWYLTPLAETEPAALRATCIALVAALGAAPVAIDPGAHDRLLALTSHLPHVLANLLVVAGRRGRASTATTRSRRSAARSAT